MQRVNRRLMTVLVSLTAATLTAGCSTFSDGDAVARVGDEKLSESDLDQQLLDAGATSEDLAGVLPGEAVRGVITSWIQETAIGLGDDDIADLYGQGLEVAGVACPSIIATENTAAANEAAERLRTGEPFDTVFAEANLDPQLVQTGGGAGCISIDQLQPEELDAPNVVALLAVDADNVAAVAEAADPAAPTLVVVLRPYAELPPEESAQVAAAARNVAAAEISLDDLDIDVASRYGRFDEATGTVVPLG